VSAAHAADAEVRLYDHLLTVADPDEVEGGRDFRSHLNASSLETHTGCKVEPGLAGASPGAFFQFLRHGYFVVDPDTTGSSLVFNRTVSLRDTWGKIERAQRG
jgi:glutaminyl-tRNA synthetase